MLLFIVQFLLAMNYDKFARPQLLLFFRFLSTIVLFVKPDQSGGPLANAKPVVMSAFYTYTDAITQSAKNFGAKLKV